MVWVSNQGSIDRSDVSILALIETLLAISLGFGIYAYFGSLKPIFYGALIAPFLLLRTRESNAQALKISQMIVDSVWSINIRCFNYINTSSSFFSRLFKTYLVGIPFMSVMLGSIIAMIIVKVGVTVYNICFNVVDSLSAIPGNWRKVVLCTDSFTPPELIPGITNVVSDQEALRFLESTDEIKETALGFYRIDILNRYLIIAMQKLVSRQGSFRERAYVFTGALGCIVVLILSYLPAIAYRWSLKSTALIWSPLLWASRAFSWNESTTLQATSIVTLGYYRITRVYSAAIIMLFIAKLYIFLVWLRISVMLESFAIWPVLSAYVLPNTIPLWHVAAFLNAALTWLMYFEAQSLLVVGYTISKVDAGHLFKVIFFARNLLSLYIIICTLYITAQLISASGVDLRPIFFPW